MFLIFYFYMPLLLTFSPCGEKLGDYSHLGSGHTGLTLLDSLCRSFSPITLHLLTYGDMVRMVIGEKLGDYSHLGYGAQKHLLKVIFFLITILHHSITFFCSFIFIWMHLCRYCFIYIFPFFLTPLAWIFFKYI